MNKIFELNKVTYITSFNNNFKKRIINDLSGEIQVPKDYGVVSIFGDDHEKLTATLKLLSGLVEPTEGKLSNSFDSSLLPFIPSHNSNVPWLNVIENVNLAFGGLKNGANEDVRKAIEATELDGYESHYPSEKSDGFQFRMSVARALSVRPPCILVDDPFRAADRHVRDEIAQLLRKVAEEYKLFIVLATSDYVQGIQAGKIYYWFYDAEICKLKQVIGADNVLSLIR
jgi:ABC-type nitrate/sulfonate/bicarbonate transport system ATPase subunit